MTNKTSYELSKFLMDKAHAQLMADLKKLNALLDSMIEDAERNRDALATALMNEAADAGAITGMCANKACGDALTAIETCFCAKCERKEATE